MEWQFYVIIALVFCFVLWQISSFVKNNARIRRMRNLFPSSDNDYYVRQENGVTTIENASGGEDFAHTVNDINKYLTKNANKTFDYQIIKEIVGRNVDALDEEVDTMLSAPLYIGLMATILGIVFGVVTFSCNGLVGVIGGEFGEIRPLLTGIGIAMVASLFGVLFTKLSTQSFNNARVQATKNKNVFLTWVQSELMSKVSDSLTGALVKMTNDLNSFNATFAGNTRNLKDTLDTVTENYRDQAELIREIKGLKISSIANANIKVYEKLKGCTEQIERLAEIIDQSRDYIATVIELNENIASIDKRTQLFEALGQYFMQEGELVRTREGIMRQQLSSLDSALQVAITELGDNVVDSLIKLNGVLQGQNQRMGDLLTSQQEDLQKAMARQQQAVNEQIGKMENPFSGVKEMFVAGVEDMRAAFSSQNDTLKGMLALQASLIRDSLHVQREELETSLSEQRKAFMEMHGAQLDSMKKQTGNNPEGLRLLTEISMSMKALNERLEKMGGSRWGRLFGWQRKKNE